MLTVRDALADKVGALESGADDYVVKPFEPEELRARARAQLRRSQAATPTPALKFGELEIDLRRQIVMWGDERVHLTRTELRLLDALLARRGKLVTHRDLITAVWGTAALADQARLRVVVLHLRRKLHDDAARPHAHRHRTRPRVPLDRRRPGARRLTVEPIVRFSSGNDQSSFRHTVPTDIARFP